MDSLAEVIEGTPYVGYSYAYPHKTAYRPLASPVPLSEVWREERRDTLFLYLHVPFCEYRCGFCNLFTQANPANDLPTCYLAQVRREAEQVRAALENARFVRLAIGGGTPTYLNEAELEVLFAIVTETMGAAPRQIPVSLEASPATVNAEKLERLRAWGVDRLSLGVQTFDDEESRRLGRPQRRHEAETALALIRAAGFPTLNVDLIYGGEEQTPKQWLDSVRHVLEFQPEELYLYPLYVRQLTGLGRRGMSWDDVRLAAYRAARELLLTHGYEQVSLRMFRAPHAPADTGPIYCCQADGMVGLGCGARSYTESLHYSTEYAVGRQGVHAILNDYVTRPAETFAAAHYGYQLDIEDQRRRHAILSLLQCAGLDRSEYQARFGGDVCDHLPEFEELELRGLASLDSDHVRLTEAGLERSDAIGPWLYSSQARRRMETYQWR